jgi:hypothetical protein
MAIEPDITTPPPLSTGDVARYVATSSVFRPEKKSKRIEDLLTDREKIKNVDLAQDVTLRRFTLKILLWFLSVETFVVFSFAFFQAVGVWGFHLEEWSFRLLLGATITQIYLMLQIAVEYLFPKNKETKSE